MPNKHAGDALMNKKLTALLFASSLIAAAGAAGACTLYAAAGPQFVDGGGTMVGKVRDWKVDLQQVKCVRPDAGYAYYGVVTGRSERFNAGVNEKGLFVGVSKAGSVSAEAADAQPKRDAGTALYPAETLIRGAASVREALALAKPFRHAENYILADRREIAFIEVLPGGPIVTRIKDSGTLVHTNHYVLPQTREANSKIGRSSRIRFKRMKELLTMMPMPARFDDFIGLSEDRNAGPDDSIWRDGSSPEKSRTRAVLAAHFSPDGSVELYVKHAPYKMNPRWFKTERFALQPGKFAPLCP